MKGSLLYENKEFGFFEIINILYKFKYSIIFVTSIFAIGSVLYALSLSNIYRSSSMLKINEDSSQSSISSTLSQYANIAGVAGLNIPSGGNSDKTQFIIETIKSRDFLEHLINIDGVKESLFASKAFDKKSNKIIFDKNIFDVNKNIWIRKPPLNKSPEPSVQEIYNEVYIKKLNIDLDKQSRFITISFDHISPIFAYEFLNLIIKEFNKVSRNKDLNESKSALNYLENASNTITQTDVKSSINTLIESQLKIQMLANARKDYLISPIDKPFIPEIKHSPNRASICIFFTMLGFFIASIFALTRVIFYNHNN